MLSRKKLKYSEPPPTQKLPQQSIINHQNDTKQKPFIKRRESTRQLISYDDKNIYLLEMLLPKINLFNNSDKGKELKRLVSCLNEWRDINDTTMLKLLQMLKENVDLLDEKMTTLVHCVLDSNWCDSKRCSKVINTYEDWLSELLVVRPCYVNVVLQSLIKKLQPPLQTQQVQNEDIEISIGDRKTFEIVHRNISKLILAFPRMKESLLKLLCSSYPYMGRSCYTHFCYVNNLLQCMNYITHKYTKGQILQIIIHKLCRVDVNISREELELIHKWQTNINENVKTENNQQLLYNYNHNPLVDILDTGMCLLFESLKQILQDLDLNELFTTFEHEVVNSFGINNVQFVYFYVLNVYPDKKIIQNFLEYCWKKATDYNTSDILRIQFMAYISGILTRANTVTVKILKRWLSRMSDWSTLYIDQRLHNNHWSNVNIQTHGPFYAVCQTIFYVFAFRNNDLITSRKCVAYTGTLNLGRLVTCDLNPLKAVIEPVAIAFVNAAHTHQISYCRTVLERNQRATIPENNSTINNTLEAFFPFDPFLLRRSKSWIDPYYRVYQPYLPELKIEKEEEVVKLETSDNCIDMMELDSNQQLQQIEEELITVVVNNNSDDDNSFIQLMEHSSSKKKNNKRKKRKKI